MEFEAKRRVNDRSLRGLTSGDKYRDLEIFFSEKDIFCLKILGISIFSNSFNLSSGPSAVTAMPLFSWMKWPHETRGQSEDETQPLRSQGILPSRMLITELLWHVEERERLARELEREHRLAHAALGLRWFQKYPRLRTLIPTSELHQLEFLCAQIPPVHTATVLSRFREVLATNNISPWELASVFKQVLRDFLIQKENDEKDTMAVQRLQVRPMETWTNRYKMKQGFVTPTVPSCGDHPFEEIPTISGYVDRVMRHSGSFVVTRDWDLPYYYPVPLRPKGAHSTSL